MNQNNSSSSLDLPAKDFEALLNKSAALILDQFKNLDQQPGYTSYPAKEIRNWFDESLPEQGMTSDHLFGLVKEKVFDTATGNLGPHMYGYVMAGGTQMSIVAEQLSATINQNMGKWHLGPAINEIEVRVVQWAKEMMGYPGEGGGIFVSGGSEANLAGLTIARNIFFEKFDIRKNGLFGQAPFTVYASSEVHSCVDKSLELLGIGTNHLRRVACNDDFTINLQALKAQIQQDIYDGFQPFCLIGTAGTVNTGAIDNLDALADIAQAHEMWFHVDGAYGALAAILPGIKSQYNGISRADSVAMDFHKWLYQPFESGCVLVKNWDILRRSYFKKASYLASDFEGEQARVDFNEHYFQLSRCTKSFKVWMSIKYYGFAKIRAMIQKDIDLTHYLADKIEVSSDFALKSRSSLAVACFQYKGNLTDTADIITLNQQLIPALEKDGRVFITGTILHGEFVLRACLINHRKTEATTDYLLDVIREVGESLL